MQLLFTWLLFLISGSVPVAFSLEDKCETLQASFTYTQEEAPRDLSGLLPVVVGRVNQVLDGVVDVNIEWTGADLHGRVGKHFVKAQVTRMAGAVRNGNGATQDERGRWVVTQCFLVPFTILDTNECLLPTGHPMRHQCHSSTICVNTVGAYECLCPSSDQVTIPATADDTFWQQVLSASRSPWERSFNSTSLTSCPSAIATHGCCPDRVYIKPKAATCRAAFRCPVDPCTTTDHTCAPSATCQRAAHPSLNPNYTCLCPPGLMGNGHVCKKGIDPKPRPAVKFDGITPTEETIRNHYYCDCTKPILDACAGFPPCRGKHEKCTVSAGNVPHCACEVGYVRHDTYGCVDMNPPELRLRNDPNGDHILRIRQGEVYQEAAVEILDENAEEYLRSLKITYSQPLPHGCFEEMGEFHVNYTVATPWTTPPYVRITRRVIIEDIDECTAPETLLQSCPLLRPRCVPDAQCINTVGSYTCRCPQFMSGDGFTKFAAFEELPEGYQGGSGCKDTTKPVITLQGPNPKIVTVSACGGVRGILRGPTDVPELKRAQRDRYHSAIKDLIHITGGAELCATVSNPRTNASDCVLAYDQTHKGKIDLAKHVRVGDPVQKDTFHWRVPYDVSDAAGNAANTVWRDVIVEEIDSTDAGAKLRGDIVQETEAAIQAAVKKAVADTERRMEADFKLRLQIAIEEDRGNQGQPPSSFLECPACPSCDCPTAKVSNREPRAEIQCTVPSKPDITCYSVNTDHPLVKVLDYVPEYFSLETILATFLISISIFVLFVVRWIVSMIVPSSEKTYIASDERERRLLDSVRVLRSPMHNPMISNGLLSDISRRNEGIPPHSSPPSATFWSPTTTMASPQPDWSGIRSNPSSLLQQPEQEQPRYGSDYNHTTDIYTRPEIITPRSRRGANMRTRE